jgi:penicillin-binding protein 1B
VPAYFALKNSLNAATASLGIEAGLEHVAQMGKLAGINSKLEALPSLTLGAAEIYPTEVLEAYVFLARLGNHIPLSFVRAVVSPEGNSMYEFKVNPEQRLDSSTVSELVSMMKQTVLTGTARALAARGFKHPAAGKTGTTSDYKDAWFAGFTPYQTTVTWVGYDNNTSHGLTGASGPLPIWSDYMISATQKYAADDFQWPENTEVIPWHEKLEKEDNTVNLVFKKGIPRSQ